MGMLPLFDNPPGFDRQSLADALRCLSQQGIFIGGSSWKYEGWLGQIYTPERYLVRGRFSQKRFRETCLSEYAETFPIVCGDFSFYQFPPPEFWRKLFASAGPDLRFAFKAPEEITCKSFPVHPRYGARAGLANPAFLDPAMLDSAFLQPLLDHAARVAILIFEFGTFSSRSYDGPEQFLRDLDDFLSRLPASFRYAVEIRNPEFLIPEYFDVLGRRRVAHVFNAWTRMPSIRKQMEIPGAFTTDVLVARALLKEGRSYEEAVSLFSPYDQVRDESPETRTALRELIRASQNRKIPAYLFINNRLEGNTPTTIQAVVDETTP